jgi:hypothetical protein
MDTMKNNRAVLKLLALGMDSSLAENLHNSGWTPPKLRRQSDWEMMNLGIPPEIRRSLQFGEPPAIPINTLSDVLDASRGMCCICRLPNQTIAAHAIIPLAAGGSYSPHNLVILCKYHQIEANAMRPARSTSQSGPMKDWLVTAKKTWEVYYEESDFISTIQSHSKRGELNWWYFNLRGLCEVVKTKVELNQLPRFKSVLSKGLCDTEGVPIYAQDAPSPYEGDGGVALYSYMFEILFELLGMRSLKNIYPTDRHASVIGTVHKGDLICFHGEHTFDDVPSANTDQPFIRATCTFRKVEITFVFDLGESTSKLARSNWLCGQKKLTSFMLVSKAGWAGAKYCIVGSVMAIRSDSDQINR